jgi:hypothetical protein
MAVSNNLVNLDRQGLIEAFKSFLRSQTKFQDYDFDGANISVLMDLLGFNTNINGFYLNMIGNEMFMDSAQIRASAVSHAKELNYVPRSFTGARADLQVVINTGNVAITTITAPKGTSFTTRVGSNTYTFSTDENIVLTGDAGVFTGDVTVYEGVYVTDTYVYRSDDPTQRFVLTNETVDVGSLSVTVIENSGADVYTYTRATNLYDLNSTSKIFFVQMTENEKYEIVFGDGVIGRTPADNSTVVLEARVCHGELPNGAFKFVADGTIGGYSNVAVTTVSAASGGSIYESLNSIKFNAPRAFTTQERAITPEDYENLLRAEFPEINAVSAYGGEEADPPRFGKVFVSVDLQNFDGLPKSKEIIYKKFLKRRSPMSIDPVFVTPDYLYIYVGTTVRYNVNLTNLSENDIRLLTVSAISDFSSTNLDDFKATLRYSQLVSAIDDAHSSIVSNDTKILALKKISPVFGVTSDYVIDFGLSFNPNTPGSVAPSDPIELSVVRSSQFRVNDRVCVLEGGTDGVLWLSYIDGAVRTKAKPVGNFNVTTGKVSIQGLRIDTIVGGSSVLKLYAIPENKDITAARNMIIAIADDDISTTIETIRE